MRRRSCCDAPRHAFANLAPKYQFATCISAACRDTFLQTARLWRSGSTDQIYRGCVRAKCPLNFTRSLLRKHLHALRIYTRRGARIRDAKNEAVCARDAKYRGAKYRGAGSGRAVHETSRKAKRLLGLRSRRPSKIGFFKISPARRSQKSAFKFFSPAQILKSAL